MSGEQPSPVHNNTPDPSGMRTVRVALFGAAVVVALVVLGWYVGR